MPPPSTLRTRRARAMNGAGPTITLPAGAPRLRGGQRRVHTTADVQPVISHLCRTRRRWGLEAAQPKLGSQQPSPSKHARRGGRELYVRTPLSHAARPNPRTLLLRRQTHPLLRHSAAVCAGASTSATGTPSAAAALKTRAPSTCSCNA
jgi:hypothetical protein